MQQHDNKRLININDWNRLIRFINRTSLLTKILLIWLTVLTYLLWPTITTNIEDKNTQPPDYKINRPVPTEMLEYLD